MTRPTSLSALRTSRPLFTSTSNGCASRSFRFSVPTSTSLTVPSSQLCVHRPFAVPTRQLHFSPTKARLSSAPQPKQDQQSSPDWQPSSEHKPPPKPEVLPSRDEINPSAISRPPPLNLPERQPDTSTVKHLFNTGKAYLTFYKTGLKQIWGMTQLVRSGSLSEEARSTIVLRQRWSHDVRRLPLFAVILLVCGEFTPFVVLLVPQAVPFTCRIPQQVQKLRKRAEERRRIAREEVKNVERESTEVKMPLQARILGLMNGLWDRVGWVPTRLARRKVENWLGFIVRDDEMLVKGGGVEALQGDEVVLACIDRGINTVDRDVEELRKVLGKWLKLTTKEGAPEDDRIRTIERLVLDGEEKWNVVEQENPMMRSPGGYS